MTNAISLELRDLYFSSLDIIQKTAQWKIWALKSLLQIHSIPPILSPPRRWRSPPPSARKARGRARRSADRSPRSGARGGHFVAKLSPPPAALFERAYSRRGPSSKGGGNVHRGRNSYIELLKYDLNYIPGGGDRTAGRARRSAPSPGGVLGDGDFLLRQPAKLADEAVDLPIGLLVAGLCIRKPPGSSEHILGEGHRQRVAGNAHRGYNCFIELLKYDLKYTSCGERPLRRPRPTGGEITGRRPRRWRSPPLSAHKARGQDRRSPARHRSSRRAVFLRPVA